MKKIANSFLMALLGGVVSLGIYKAVETEPIPPMPSPEKEQTQLVNLVNSEPGLNSDYITAAEMTVNGVVHVKTEGTLKYKRRGFDPIREFFYGNGMIEKQYSYPIQGAGSGVIISEDGYLVTNNHVIENADRIKVTLNNKKTYEAELVGRDPSTDLAVLKIEENNLPFLEYGNSDDLRIGEWVLAVGNPFNLTSTVTAGIVSAKSRDIDILDSDPYSGLNSIESFIQTDAAVNPGNSGGALVNTQGKLVGINAAIKSNTGSYAGYSFAIPSNIVRKVVRDLIEFGVTQRAFIGVNILNINNELAEKEGLSSLKGVYVSDLVESGSAKEAGIEKGDVILAINEHPVNNVSELQAKVGEHRPGDQIEVQILRGEETLTKTVTLKNLEGSFEVISGNEQSILQALGVKFERPTQEELKALNLKNGVKVKELFPGKLLKAGVKEGFIITAVDNQNVSSQKELIHLLKNKKGGVLIQGMYGNGLETYYAFGL